MKHSGRVISTIKSRGSEARLCPFWVNSPLSKPCLITVSSLPPLHISCDCSAERKFHGRSWIAGRWTPFTCTTRTIRKVGLGYAKKLKNQVESCPIDLQIVAIKDTSITRTYLLDVKDDTRQSADLRKAVIFAREQLLQEAKKNGYNILWLERYYLPYFLLELSVWNLLRRSWQVTLLRKGRLYRVEVQYKGRRKSLNNSAKLGNRIILLNSYILIAARTLNKVPNRHPPFMALLQTWPDCILISPGTRCSD